MGNHNPILERGTINFMVGEKMTIPFEVAYSEMLNRVKGYEAACCHY